MTSMMALWLSGCVLVSRDDIRHVVDTPTTTTETDTDTDTDTDSDTDADTDADSDADSDSDTDTDTGAEPTGETGIVEPPLCPDPGKLAFHPTIINVPNDLTASDAFRIGGLVSPLNPIPNWEINRTGDEMLFPVDDSRVLTDVPTGSYFIVVCLDRAPSNFLCDGAEDTLISSGSTALLVFEAGNVLTVEVDMDARVMNDIVFSPKDPSCP
jgi:hypothetical protein